MLGKSDLFGYDIGIIQNMYWELTVCIRIEMNKTSTQKQKGT